jgi:Recombinase
VHKYDPAANRGFERAIEFVHPTRPTAVPDELVRHIHGEHTKGKSMHQIARDLNAGQTPTAHGGAQWWPSTVRSVLVRSSPPETARASAPHSAP